MEKGSQKVIVSRIKSLFIIVYASHALHKYEIIIKLIAVACKWRSKRVEVMLDWKRNEIGECVKQLYMRVYYETKYKRRTYYTTIERYR